MNDQTRSKHVEQKKNCGIKIIYKNCASRWSSSTRCDMMHGTHNVKLLSTIYKNQNLLPLHRNLLFFVSRRCLFCKWIQMFVNTRQNHSHKKLRLQILKNEHQKFAKNGVNLKWECSQAFCCHLFSFLPLHFSSLHFLFIYFIPNYLLCFFRYQPPSFLPFTF